MQASVACVVLQCLEQGNDCTHLRSVRGRAQAQVACRGRTDVTDALNSVAAHLLWRNCPCMQVMPHKAARSYTPAVGV
eukprot:15335925-Alexandrium_andersonii.AAC.1